MTDPVTAITASTIATLAFQEFVKSGAGELAKKFTTDAIAKMSDLRKKIVDRLKGKSATVDAAIEQAAQGEPVAIETLGRYLDVAMLDYPEFATEIRQLAQEINAGKILDNSAMTQNVTGNDNMNVQAKAEQGGKQWIAEKMFFGVDEKD